MTPETLAISSQGYRLSLSKDFVLSQYPSIGQSWLEMLQNIQQTTQKTNVDRIILDCLILSTKFNDDPISYKIVKLQRLLNMLCRLSKKLTNFQKVQQIVRIQALPANSKKNGRKQQTVDENNLNKSYFLEKGENIFYRIIKQKKTLIAILSLPELQSSMFSLEDFFKNIISNIRKSASQKYGSEENLQLKKFLSQKFLQLVNSIEYKFILFLHSMVTSLKIIADNDKVLNNFLNLEHKFFKVQNVKTVSIHGYQNNKKQYGKRQQNLDLIYEGLFQILVQIPKTKKNQQNVLLTEESLANINLKINWSYNNIQKTCHQIQVLYRYFYGMCNENQKSPRQEQQNFGEKMSKIEKQFILSLRAKILTINSQFLASVFDRQQINWILQKLEIEQIDYIPLLKQQLQEKQKQMDVQNKSNNQTSQSIQSMIKDQLFNHQFDIQQEEPIEKDQQQNPFLPSQIISLSFSQSQQFIESYYQCHVETVYSFIECQKQWFYRNKTMHDSNTRIHYKFPFKWIPLQKNINAQLRFQNEFSSNSFSKYISSIVYSFFQPKKGDKVVQYFQKHNLQEIETESLQNNLSPQYFIYNDMQNILAYQNFSFQNVYHCFYYLKHIKNDNRTEFEDRSWVQMLSQQNVRLHVKKAKKSKILELGQVKLISMPVRGRFCRHLDFFDLSEVYHLMYPYPYCSPQAISCPKCFIDIPFEEIIYLRQVETLIEMIKLFYIEFGSQNRQNLKQKNQPMRKRSEQEQKSIILQDIRLIINHQEQSIKLRTKYTQSLFSLQQFSTIENELVLEPVIYQTLLNPNKKFHRQEKLKKFLNGYGMSKLKAKQNQFYEQTLGNEQNGSCLSFDQRIEIALMSIKRKSALYKDLEKGTVQL